MRIGLYSFDVGPGRLLALVADAARKLGHDVIISPPLAPVPVEMYSSYESCDVGLFCPSSVRIEEELTIMDLLIKHNAPFAMIDDVPYTVARRTFPREYAAYASVAFLAMPQRRWEVIASEHGYRASRYIGPPPHWGTAYQEMVEGPNIRESLRKIVRGERTAIGKNDVIVFFSGMKNPPHVNVILENVKRAGLEVIGRERFVLGFKPHPGEERAYPEEYRRHLPKRETILADDSIQLLELPELPFETAQPTLMKAVDVPILTGGSTNSIVAAYARMTILYCTDDEIRRRLEDQGVPGGVWFISELGGVISAEGAEEIPLRMKELLSGDGRIALRQKQEENFPLPKTWNTAPLIVQALEGL